MSDTQDPSPSRVAAFNCLNNAFLENETLTAKVIEDIQKNGKELHQVIDKLASVPEVSKADVERLSFLQELIEVTNGEWKVLGRIVKAKTASSMHDVAIQFYDDKAKFWEAIAGSAVLSQFQRSLFQRHPVSVVLGAIQSGRMQVDSHIKELVSNALSTFAASRASLRDQRLATHFRTWVMQTEEKETEEDGIKCTKTVQLLESIQRLAAILTSPLDIMRLIEAKFTSAQSIAATEVGRFIQLCHDQGIGSDKARAIHNSATTIEYRNEEAWIALLQTQQNVFKPGKTAEAPAAKPVARGGKQLYNMTTMFKLEDQQLGEGYSIFSLSAYLVQLLRFLQVCPCLPKPPAEYGEKESKSLSSSLFERLSARRPDLQKMELSHENDSVLVDYIDLANEVMESFIVYLQESAEGRKKKDATAAFNSTCGVPSKSQHLPHPKQLNTNHQVYKDGLARQMYPMQTFPYIHSLESTRSMLSALGTSRLDVMRCFRSEFRTASKLLTPDDYKLYQSRPEIASHVGQFLDRAEVAEKLNLSHEDFLAITGECFWPSQTASLFLRRSLTSHIDVESPHFGIAGFWGYKSSDYHGDKEELTESQLAINAMVDDTTGVGLAFVKEQFLPRSGLAFDDLIALLRTQYVAHRLTIVPMTEAGRDFEGHLSDMKLRVSVVDSGNQPPGKLTTGLCEELHSFVRLRQKLGWDVAKLDRCISCLKRNATRLGLSGIYSRGIPSQLLAQLSAVKELSECLGDVDVEELLPLWADLDTYDSTSKYARLFLRRDDDSSSERSRLFSSNLEGKYLGSGRPFADYERHILDALQLSREDLSPLMDAAGLNMKSTMTLQSFSLLYRLLTLCRILEVPYADCAVLLKVLETSYDLFSDPRSTLEAVKTLKALFSQSWDLGSLALVLKIPSGTQAELLSEGPALTLNNISKEVSTVLRNVQPSLEAALASSATMIQESVVSMATKIFGTGLGNEVAHLINAQQPSQQEEDQKRIITLIEDRLLSDGGQLFDPKEYRALLFSKPSTETSLPRMQAFLKLCVVDLAASSLQQSFIDKAREAFPDVDISILNSAVSATGLSLRPQLDQAAASRAVMKDLVIQSTTQEALSHRSLHTPSTGTYCYYLPAKHISDEGPEPRLIVNGILVAATKDEASSYYLFGPLLLKGGEEAEFSANFDLQNIVCSEALDEPSPLLSQLVIPVTVEEKVHRISQELVGVLTLVQKFNLDKQELEFFATSSRDSKFKLSIRGRSIASLAALDVYSKLRDSSKVKASPLVGLLAWLQRPDEVKDVYKRVAATLGVSEFLVRRLTTAKYEGLSDLDVTAQLQDIQQLASLQEITRYCAKTGLRTDDAFLKALFGLAVPSKPFDQAGDFTTASSLRALLQPVLGPDRLAKHGRKMQVSQRDALVSYLLQQKDVQDVGLRNADSLFEYFFIDVLMGPDLQTTRTKQAISTIQLYVQRCLLGLEQESGVFPDNVSRAQWAWMQRFSLWEANRKLALYPENWIDPALRDNKTDLFKTFETALLANDLSMDTFTKKIQDYICSLHDISDLDVQGYTQDVYPPRAAESGKQGQKSKAPSQVTDSYHFFAATRTSPYEYYYRKMIIAPSSNHVFWSPWAKIDIDIMQVEADWDGAALSSTGVYLIPAMRGRRLYLFMPQIMLKTTANQDSFKSGPSADKQVFSYKSMADRPVDSSQPGKKWEVKMAWSELIDGQWLPKKTSAATLLVEARTVSNLKNQLPSIANFHFYIKTRTKEDLAKDFLSIGVACRYADSSYWYLGSFDVKGDAISVSNLDAPRQRGSGSAAINTKFNKYTANKSVAESISSKLHYGENTLSPLLTISDVEDAKPSNTEITWTLAYDSTEANQDEHKISGLVYDVLEPGSVRASKFTYLAGGFQSNMTGKDLSRLGVNETFNFPTAMSLKRQIRSSEGDNNEEISTARNAIAKLSETKADILVEVFGKRNGSWHEMSSPYALYSWEICVHALMLAMERLLATQQYDLAIKVARLVFNPTAEGSTRDRCWTFPPFQELPNEGHKSIKDVLADLENATNTDLGTSEKMVTSNRSVAHAAARRDPKAYMKRIMVKYIEILMAAGDEYFRQGSLEAMPLAIQRYIEAAHVLGPDPPLKPNLGKRKIKTFQTLDAEIVDLELEFPFSCEMEARSEGDKEVISPNGYLCTMRTSYFSIPPNPELARLRAELKLRLYRIRNSLDIRGNPIKYAILEPSIDPGKLASLAASTGGLSASSANTLLEENSSPMPNYRFAHLISRAYDMCNELRSFGEQLLAIKEKKDGEALAALRARQEVAIQDMAVGLKRLHLEEANRTLEAMQRTRLSHVTRLSYYLSLIGEKPGDWIPAADKDFRELEQTWEPILNQAELRMTLSEKVEMTAGEVAAKINLGASAIDLQCSALVALPNIIENIEPMGMGVSFKMDATNIAKGMGIISQAMRMGASMVSDLGSRTAKKGQLLKQLQDRRLQANLAGHDIKNIDKQIEAHKKRIEAAEKEIEQQLETAKNAREVEHWYKSKFTSEQLYLWMENSVRTMYFEAYTLALELAKRAERVLQFENGHPAGLAGTSSASRSTQVSFIRPEGYWDSSRAGLLAGQNLMLALKRMEMANQERRAHDFEVTKSISLRAVDPLALLTLRETGSAEFSLTETLFDMDFPGHYMRRIKGVSVTIPCIVGPHTSIGATLTLVKHRYRIDGTATNWADYVKQREQDGAAFATDRIPLESIAVSSGQSDSGVFELDFHGERFMPFEGAGLISTWRLDLPTAMRQFDYHTIADVVLQVRYTARSGGAGLRTAASDSVVNLLKDLKMAGGLGLLSTVWDLRGEWSNEWFLLSREISNAGGKKESTIASVMLGEISSRLPYWTRGQQVKVNKITLVVSPSREDWKERIKVSVCQKKEWSAGLVGDDATKLECTGLGVTIGERDSWKLSVAAKDAEDGIKLEKLLVILGYSVS